MIASKVDRKATGGARQNGSSFLHHIFNPSHPVVIAATRFRLSPEEEIVRSVTRRNVSPRRFQSGLIKCYDRESSRHVTVDAVEEGGKRSFAATAALHLTNS